MKTIEGTYTFANIFTTNNEVHAIEDYALAQIQMICDQEASKNCRIRVMPDVHPGKVGPIGLTQTLGDKIILNLLGIDIGCGMTLAQIKGKKIEYQKLDTVIIEADKDDDGNLYIVIHSGSRRLGKEVTEYYLNQGQKVLKEQGLQIPYELTWPEGDMMQHYLHDLQIVQKFASLNREIMLDELIKGMKWKVLDSYECIHNYVDNRPEITELFHAPMLRKGAISTLSGEKVIIPINMRDGILLGTGKGNPNWNCSAPHGSGRIMKREDVKSSFTVSSFKSVMKGIYSSCINKDTLDEAPFAYRSMVDMLDVIQDTVDITNVLRPVYNFKAGGK